MIREVWKTVSQRASKIVFLLPSWSLKRLVISDPSGYSQEIFIFGFFSETSQKNVQSKDSSDNDSSPLTLDETTSEAFPKHLSNILERLNLKVTTKYHIVMILIYTLAIECGFYPFQLMDRSNEDFLWKSNLTFSKKLMEKFSNYAEDLIPMDEQNYRIILGFSNFVVKLILNGTISGDLLIITFTIDAHQKEQGKSIVISVPRYLPLPLQNRQSTIGPSNFRNLKELSFKMKEFVFVPIRSILLYYRDDCIYPHLLGIPAEVRRIISSYLNVHDELQLSACCQQLRAEYKEFSMMLQYGTPRN